MSWMVTATGRKFYPLDPRACDISIVDIATGLAKVCRFGGHCDGWYSVAEHSVHVSYLVPPEYALQGLLHDATEAYYGDIVRPFKDGLPDYAVHEAKLWGVIAGVFGLPEELHPSVKQADLDMLLAEKAALFPNHTDPWNVKGTAANVQVRRWDWGLARYMFHRRFQELYRSAA